MKKKVLISILAAMIVLEGCGTERNTQKKETATDASIEATTIEVKPSEDANEVKKETFEVVAADKKLSKADIQKYIDAFNNVLNANAFMIISGNTKLGVTKDNTISYAELYDKDGVVIYTNYSSPDGYYLAIEEDGVQKVYRAEYPVNEDVTTSSDGEIDPQSVKFVGNTTINDTEYEIVDASVKYAEDKSVDDNIQYAEDEDSSKIRFSHNDGGITDANVQYAGNDNLSKIRLFYKDGEIVAYTYTIDTNLVEELAFVTLWDAKMPEVFEKVDEELTFNDIQEKMIKVLENSNYFGIDN